MDVNRKNGLRVAAIGLAAGLLLGLAMCQAQEPQYDLLVVHGRILDGTGSPAIDASVAVKDGKIAEIGRLDRQQPSG
jgi:N-acyl-D-amino-acid deacylase